MIKEYHNMKSPSPNLERAVKRHHEIRLKDLLKMKPEETLAFCKGWQPHLIKRFFIPKLKEESNKRPIKFNIWQDLQRKIQIAEHHITQETINKVAQIVEEEKYG